MQKQGPTRLCGDLRSMTMKLLDLSTLYDVSIASLNGTGWLGNEKQTSRSRYHQSQQTLSQHVGP